MAHCGALLCLHEARGDVPTEKRIYCVVQCDGAVIHTTKKIDPDKKLLTFRRGKAWVRSSQPTVSFAVEVFQKRLLHKDSSLGTSTIEVRLGESMEYEALAFGRFTVIASCSYFRASPIPPPLGAFLMLDLVEVHQAVEIQTTSLDPRSVLFAAGERVLEMQCGVRSDTWRIHTGEKTCGNFAAGRAALVESAGLNRRNNILQSLAISVMDRLAALGFRCVRLSPGVLARMGDNCIVVSPNAIFMHRISDPSPSPPTHLILDPCYVNSTKYNYRIDLVGILPSDVKAHFEATCSDWAVLECHQDSSSREVATALCVCDSEMTKIPWTIGRLIKKATIFYTYVMKTLNTLHKLGYSLSTPIGDNFIMYRDPDGVQGAPADPFAILTFPLPGDLNILGSLSREDVAAVAEHMHSTVVEKGRDCYGIKYLSCMLQTQQSADAREVKAGLAALAALAGRGYQFCGPCTFDALLVQRTPRGDGVEGRGGALIFVQPEVTGIMSRNIIAIGGELTADILLQIQLGAGLESSFAEKTESDGSVLYFKAKVSLESASGAKGAAAPYYYHMLKLADSMYLNGWDVVSAKPTGIMVTGTSGSWDVTDAGLLFRKTRELRRGTFCLVVMYPYMMSTLLQVYHPSERVPIASVARSVGVDIEPVNAKGEQFCLGHTVCWKAMLTANEINSGIEQFNDVQNAYVNLVDALLQRGGVHLFSWGQFGSFIFFPENK